MGNQCCSGTPCESNQVVTTATRELQKPGEQDLSMKRKVDHMKNQMNEAEDNQENDIKPEHNVNVFEKNQDEHYPTKAIAVEIDTLPQIDNLCTISLIFSIKIINNSCYGDLCKVRCF